MNGHGLATGHQRGGPPATYRNPRIAFELGETCAFQGVPPFGVSDPDFMQGYALGREQHGHRPPCTDRFVRKWLQLRWHAYLRNRWVDASVTPQHLREIDSPICFVTGEPLTHATGAETDWSVDRLCNDGGYAQGNIVIMSTRANKAKSDLSYEEVARLALGSATGSGLSPRQWARLANVMAGACQVPHRQAVRQALPVAEFPLFVPVHPSLAAQEVLARSLTLPQGHRRDYWRLVHQALGGRGTSSCVDALAQGLSRQATATPQPSAPTMLCATSGVWPAFERFWQQGIFGGTTAQAKKRYAALHMKFRWAGGHQELASALYQRMAGAAQGYSP